MSCYQVRLFVHVCCSEVDPAYVLHGCIAERLLPAWWPQISMVIKVRNAQDVNGEDAVYGIHDCLHW